MFWFLVFSSLQGSLVLPCGLVLDILLVPEILQVNFHFYEIHPEFVLCVYFFQFIFCILTMLDCDNFSVSMPSGSVSS